LGHRRLSIVDLSPLGRNPMSWGNGRFWITFNGEIYNFLELRQELEAAGHRFRSRTDTEVILAA
jgi:asparagine synthase (glutamine-hydrolysing)